MLQAVLLLMAALVAPPPKDTQLEALVQKLGDDDFRVREKAQEDLDKAMNLKRYYALREHPQRGKDLETDRRLGRVLTKFKNRFKAEVLAKYPIDLKGYPDHPFIDSLPHDFKWREMDRWMIINRYRELAQSLGAPNNGSPIWTDYRRATEYWLPEVLNDKCEALLEGKPVSEKGFHKRMEKALKEIDEIVKKLIDGDNAWWKGPHNNPLLMPKLKPDA